MESNRERRRRARQGALRIHRIGARSVQLRPLESVEGRGGGSGSDALRSEAPILADPHANASVPVASVTIATVTIATVTIVMCVVAYAVITLDIDDGALDLAG